MSIKVDKIRIVKLMLVSISILIFTQCSNTTNSIVIEEQGSFTVGGTVISNPGTFNPYNPTPEGQTLHGDHAYVFYQVPVNARKYPLVLWHGFGQFSKTWETTPDGREGYKKTFSCLCY